MKKLLFIIVMLLAISCNKKTEEPKDVTPEVTLNVTNSVTSEMTLNITTPATSWPQYDDGTYIWEIEFDLYTNVHHPAGYVIFRKISKWIADEEKQSWMISYGPSNYIEEIHYNLQAKHRNGSYEEHNVFLPSNKTFRNAFRTAEAIYLAYIASGQISPVSVAEVKRAAIRMEGRVFGIKNK